MADDKDKPEEDDVADIDGDVEEGTEGEEEEGKKKGLPKIVLIAAPIVFLILVGAGLFFTGTLDSLLGKKDAAHAEAGEHGGDDGHGDGHGGDSGHGGGAVVFLSVPDMIVNLKSSSKQQRYLKLRVELEIKGAEALHEVEKVAPRVIDHFQTYLRELRVRDLEGSQGIYRLRQELLARVNAAAYPVQVEDVLFQEILIQ